jgi:hypothetical protein
MFRFLKCLWKAETFSPAAFLGRAAVISLLYAVSCIAGLQEYTAFLSGTSANLNLSWQTAALLGLIHLLLHIAFILLVPISLITAGLLVAWNRWRRRCEIPIPQEVVAIER